MHIKEIISQHRRDFRAIYQCEHCQNEEVKGGYDDRYFHDNVIPQMECSNCNQKANPQACRGRATKYPEGYQI